ncbi:MAG: hypothetical protein Q9191_004272 [Dirinaria sp. TL-2023a]
MEPAPRRDIWRGHNIQYWNQHAATIAGLHKIITTYGGSKPTTGTRRQSLIFRAMQVLDDYRPQLTDEEAYAAICFRRAAVQDAEAQTTGQLRENDEHIREEQVSEIAHKDAVEKSSESGDLEESPSQTPKNTQGSPQLQGTPQSSSDLVNAPSSRNNTPLPEGDETSGLTTANETSRTSRPDVEATMPPKQPLSAISIPSDASSPIQVSLVNAAVHPRPISAADNLRYLMKRVILDVTDANLQIAERCSRLLPTRRTPVTKTIVDQKAFESLFNDKVDPSITAIQVEFVRGQNTDPHFYRCSRTGHPVPYRGRGPIWSRNSCHVDCCIVAARLMDVGQTSADVSNSALEGFTSFQKAFRDVVAMPWEIYGINANIRCRDNFLKQYYDHRTELGRGCRPGSMLAANDSWQICAHGFRQFEYSCYQQTTCEKCSRVSPQTASANSQKSNVLEFDAPSMDDWKKGEPQAISSLFQKHFSPRPWRRCRGRGCEGQTFRTRIIQGELPYRLVLPTPTIPSVKSGETPIPKDRNLIGSTASCVSVEYHNQNGLQTAHYRWLGGIYEHNRHFRVYWSDRSVGDPSKLIIYDGMRLNGSVIGGVPPYRSEDKVPPPWSNGCDLLFFERINPAKARINAEWIRAEINNVLSQEQLLHPKRSFCQDSSSASNKRPKNSPGRVRSKSLSPRQLRSQRK